jgi:hypothetical protein
MTVKRQMLCLIFLFLLNGCIATKPQVDMSWYNKSAEGTAGIYFYQWKTGVLGSYSDVRFKLDGETLGKINTGEWLYFEVPAGIHKYRFDGGILPQYIEHDFVEGQNYFFRGFILMGADSVVLINDEKEIMETIKNIESGRYQPGDKDSFL